ncbi:tumor necrosis factor receptor superfamily member 1A-like [Candoia aspera]|uniref:tumor necrosis factor receptor superfamily member 1A-like n=1 Tax=Candoia aspera TaxID=51853 RepID=UPI002FD7B11C
MIPLGFFQVLVVTVNLILIQLKTGESLAVPLISEPLQIHGALAEKHALIHSDRRERREVTCQEGYHPHPNGTHCCIKCHIGTYVAEHCAGPDKATKCAKCPFGTYMPQHNYLQRCFGCQKCRSSFQQITQSSCTHQQNTVCGCGSNQYKTTSTSEFLCMNCSDCYNGKIRQHCKCNNDTICECHVGFFLQAHQNKCFPCSSCNKEDCKELCDALRQAISPSNSTELVFALSCLSVIFGVGFVSLLMCKAIKKYFPERQYFSSSNQQPKKQVASKMADKAKDSLLDIKEDKIWSTVLPLGQGQGQELPDCIKSARETLISDCPAVLYTVVDRVPISRWKEFVRYLGLSENTIERIFMEQRHLRDAQYEMLREWRLLVNHDATVERISQVLSQMELSGCFEVIQEALAKQ